jgi:hypothetical protein
LALAAPVSAEKQEKQEKQEKHAFRQSIAQNRKNRKNRHFCNLSRLRSGGVRQGVRPPDAPWAGVYAATAAAAWCVSNVARNSRSITNAIFRRRLKRS